MRRWRPVPGTGIEHIAAYSPQARGRSERVFRTLQDRLPKELKLAGITTVEAANRFLKEQYLPRHNARLAIAPEEAGSAFVAVEEAQWRDVLAIQVERTVAADQHRGLEPSAAADPAPFGAGSFRARQGQGV
jgi:hypothetical protein